MHRAWDKLAVGPRKLKPEGRQARGYMKVKEQELMWSGQVEKDTAVVVAWYPRCKHEGNGGEVPRGLWERNDGSSSEGMSQRLWGNGC